MFLFPDTSLETFKKNFKIRSPHACFNSVRSLCWPFLDFNTGNMDGLSMEGAYLVSDSESKRCRSKYAIRFDQCFMEPVSVLVGYLVLKWVLSKIW